MFGNQVSENNRKAIERIIRFFTHRLNRVDLAIIVRWSRGQSHWQMSQCKKTWSASRTSLSRFYERSEPVSPYRSAFGLKEKLSFASQPLPDHHDWDVHGQWFPSSTVQAWTSELISTETIRQSLWLSSSMLQYPVFSTRWNYGRAHQSELNYKLQKVDLGFH